MRRAARTDGPHAEIRDGLRQLGYSVLDLRSVGDDCPDLLVGSESARIECDCVHPQTRHWRKCNWLLEVKSPGYNANTPHAKAQAAKQAQWKGPFRVVTSLDEALAFLREPL